MTLQFKELLELMEGGVAGATPPDPVVAQAQRYAADIWGECRLPGTPPGLAYAALTELGARYLCHFEAIREDCFLIVVVSAESGMPEGHLLLDIGGQYRPLTFTDLSTGFEGEPTEELLLDSLPRLLEGGTPAAILEGGEGSYLQTYQNGPDSYSLEYQLVTTRFHFALASPATTEEVLRAFHSYAFGRYEWARDFAWVHAPIAPQ